MTTKNTKVSSAVLFIYIALGATLLGCDRPNPEYPLNTDNSRITESQGIAPASQVKSDSIIFSPLGFQKSGKFIDSPVTGLEYQTSVNAGLTDHEGTFQYTEGDVVSFHIGNITLGLVTGKDVVTPLDLVVDMDDTTLTNILQLLQTLDQDGDASNGIFIHQSVREKAQALELNTTIYDEDFTEDPSLLLFISEVSNTSNLISAEQALNHFRSTLAGL